MLIGLTCSRGDGADDGSSGVAPQAGLQHPGQLAVPEGHMTPALQGHLPELRRLHTAYHGCLPRIDHIA